MRYAVALFYWSLLAAPTLADDSAEGKLQLEVELGRGADSAEVQIDDLAATVSIESKRGIGEATIVRRSPQWPVKLTVYLGISPLEGFTATCGNRTINGSLGFNHAEFNKPVTLQIQSADGQENQKVNKVPLRITKKGKSITIELPAELLDPTAKTLKLHWVDAYR